MRKLVTGLFLCALASRPWLPSAMGGERGIEALFRKLDRDGDGKLTRQELRNAKAFDRLDGNGDGVVTLAEAQGGLARQAAGPVPNSDPRRKAYPMVTTRVPYYDPPDTPLARSLARIAAARQPLRVECTSAPKKQP